MLSTAAWMVHDTRLMFCVLLAIASIIVLISATKLPPFLSILIGTFIAGVGAGLPPEEVAKAFSKGAGQSSVKPASSSRWARCSAR